MMTDTDTGKSIRVSTDGSAGPYIMVPVAQLDRIQALLDRNRVQYWVDELAISLNGKPAITVVNLGREGDADSVQHLLDAEL